MAYEADVIGEGEGEWEEERVKVREMRGPSTLLNLPLVCTFLPPSSAPPRLHLLRRLGEGLVPIMDFSGRPQREGAGSFSEQWLVIEPTRKGTFLQAGGILKGKGFQEMKCR